MREAPSPSQQEGEAGPPVDSLFPQYIYLNHNGVGGQDIPSLNIHLNIAFHHHKLGLRVL